MRAAAELASPASHERLLDLATGTGGFLGELAAREPAPAVVVGLDSSAAMLAQVPPLRAGWRLIQARAESVPLPDESFEIVVATFLLHTLGLPQRDAVLREARRLLRRGGRLVLVTVAPPRSRTMRVLLAPLLALARRSSGALAGLRTLDPAPELERAGFSLRVARRTGCGYPAFVVLATAVDTELPPALPNG